MSSPTIVDTLRHIRGGMLLEEVQKHLAEVVLAVDTTGKNGKVSITLTVKKVSRSGAMEIVDKVASVVPEDAPLTTLMFPTPEGRLETKDPRQNEIPLNTLPPLAAPTTLRSI